MAGNPAPERREIPRRNGDEARAIPREPRADQAPTLGRCGRRRRWDQPPAFGAAGLALVPPAALPVAVLPVAVVPPATLPPSFPATGATLGLAAAVAVEALASIDGLAEATGAVPAGAAATGADPVVEVTAALPPELPVAGVPWAKAAMGMIRRPAAIRPEEAIVTTRLMVLSFPPGGGVVRFVPAEDDMTPQSWRGRAGIVASVAIPN